MRVCISCRQDLPLESFYAKGKHRRQSECKNCTRIRRAKWWKSEKGKLSSANTKLKARFGITMAEYEKMYLIQGGQCLICGANRSVLNHRLAVDHDHSNGLIRGLLCKDCNIGLGHFKDKISNLQSAVMYLENYGYGRY